ncbi:MAG: HTTM domain-containing protein, partial [Spirosomataceae bacterium]
IMPNAFAEPGEQLPTTNKQVEEPKIEKYYNKRIQNSLLIGFIVFQLIFPWRYVLYPGSLFWTEEGYRFSWRVMLMEKAGTVTFYVKGAETNREGIVNNLEFLNTHQEKQMAMQPDMILQFAHFLGEYYEKQGVKNPQVRVE